MCTATLARVLVFALFVDLAACQSLWQKPTEVVIRHRGDHFYSAPIPVQAEASKHLDFARLSEIAYWRTPEGHIDDPADRAAAHPQITEGASDPPVIASTTNCADPLLELKRSGWVYWADFPNNALNDEVAAQHLRIEVWSREDPDIVVVGFGGTSKSGKDWRSNLRWFLPRKDDDEYTEIVEHLGPAFAAEYRNRAQRPGWEFLRHAKLYATGHSLGGGLAQQFAYALPPDPDIPRVTHVFAFDPSPVTGFWRVNETIRNENKKVLFIDRIYERGEILTFVRSFINAFYPPSESEPTIVSIRYNFQKLGTPIARHNIAKLTCKLATAANSSEPTNTVTNVQ